jgi:hypothetical protein
MLYPVPNGALTQLYAGTSPEGKDFNGKVLFILLAHASAMCAQSPDDVVSHSLGQNW